jgi:hypothetical protein
LFRHGVPIGEHRPTSVLQTCVPTQSPLLEQGVPRRAHRDERVSHVRLVPGTLQSASTVHDGVPRHVPASHVSVVRQSSSTAHGVPPLTTTHVRSGRLHA